MNEFVFSLEDARRAGLLNKSGPWKDYRQIMLQRRTVATAIKFVFPDALMGVAVAEYDLHEAPDLKDVTPRRDNNAANQFWEEMNGKPTGVQTDDPAEGSESVPGPTGDQNRDAEVRGHKL